VSEEFIGAGWAFPLGTDATGRVALVTRESEIEQSIRLILGTAPGERPMRPEFGCGIHDYVFAGFDGDVAGRISGEVRASLERWEPRIEVEEVRVTQTDSISNVVHPDRVYIDIRYSISESNDPRNLVVPFYTIGEEP
jgi:phage baseplate assembly protein W